MAVQMITTLRNARANEITAAIGANGLIRIYAGAVPADAAASVAGNTLLAELTLGATFAPAASNGVLTASAITDDTAADATGTATFFRATTSAGSAVLQGTCGTSGADMILVTTSIVAGQPVQVTSCVLTEGGA